MEEADLNIIISNVSNLPIYEQIYSQIKNSIKIRMPHQNEILERINNRLFLYGIAKIIMGNRKANIAPTKITFPP